ncbi:MAG: serine protease [Clostridia bacterium]
MVWQEWVFLGCLGFGLFYSLFVIFAADISLHWFGHIEIPLLHPLMWVSGITAFGGLGFLLWRFSGFSPGAVYLFSALGGLVMAVASFFFWVAPMKHAEASTGYSMNELQGKIGEVSVTIPEKGYGEVLIPMVGGITNHIAASFEQERIGEGLRVVVVEVKDQVLYVVPYQ